MLTQTNQPEATLLNIALEAFYKTTGLNIRVEQLDVRNKQLNRPTRTIDAIAHLAADGKDELIVIEVKKTVTNATIGIAINNLQFHLQNHQGHGLLVTEYVNPAMAERLKEQGVFFIDTAGNAYLNLPPVLTYIRGNKLEKPANATTKPRMFQPTGLKILFAFICNPALINATYRDIAKVADVAVGTVGWIMNNLKEFGYIIQTGKGHRILRNCQPLFDRWVTAYPEQLRPKLLIGRYTAPDKTWWKNAEINHLGAYWGGEVAAAKLTKYLHPEIITLYVRDQPAELQFKYHLRNDPNGEIELLNVFWDKGCVNTPTDLTPPLLTYADLLQTGDQRNLETANIIYDEHLAERICEN